MLKNNRGFSLIVLVVALAVIIVITSTAVISIKGITKDRNVSEFMTDLAEVKQFIIEYVNADGTLPVEIKYGTGSQVLDAEEVLINTLTPENALDQIDENDVGAYYFVALDKLGKIHLTDENRGYIFNEGTLNVYVTTPLEYEGVKYYTLTPDLTGRDVNDMRNVPFDIAIKGNPVTWARSAEILVSVTNKTVSEGDNWNFKWRKGSASLDDFRISGDVNYFTYGDAISIKENGIYSIYVEDPEGNALVRKVVVTKVDDIPPTIYRKDGKIYIDDAETGVNVIRYKIKETNNFAISEQARNQFPQYYTSEDEAASDTMEEAIDKYLWGERNIKGQRIDTYLSEYKEYYEQLKKYYDVELDPESTTDMIENAKLEIKTLNDQYPQYAYDNRPFPNTERNIVIYVEDMAGNNTVLSAATRTELTNVQYISEDKETLTDAKIVINNNDIYTNSGDVSLSLQAIHAKYYFVSEDSNPTGTFEYFDNPDNSGDGPLHNIKGKFKLSNGDGTKTVYAFFADEARNTKRVSDTIVLDTTKPTTTAPTVSGGIMRLTVECKQTDALSGIDETSYGIKLKTQADSAYKWYHSPNDFPILEEGKTYQIKTRVTDKAGNTETSQPTDFTPVVATMDVVSSGKGFWSSTYKEKITSIEFKKAEIPTGKTSIGNMAVDTTHSQIMAYVEDDGTGNGTYKCTVISPQTIYANADATSYFDGFTNLKTITFDNFDTSKVTSMYYMFANCSKLTSIDLSKFDTSRVTTMLDMFNGCSSLTRIYVNIFNTNNVTDSGTMFSGCKNLIGGNGTTFSGDHIDKEYARIDGGPTSSTPGYFTLREN